MTKKQRKTAKPKTQQLSFEDSLEHLKRNVSELEEGSLSLSESLEVYESGIKHLKLCHQALEQVRRKIELLVDIDESGNLLTQPFDDAATFQSNQHSAGGHTEEQSATNRVVSDDSDIEDEENIGKNPVMSNDNDVMDDADRLF
jgi:exodeoxyribonuclease VII small subunit